MSHMIKVLLIHQNKVEHYRVAVYNYLADYFKKYNFELNIVSNGVEKGNPHSIEFNFHEINLTSGNIFSLVHKIRPQVIILFVNLKYLYLFPVIFYAKLRNIKTICWVHGIDLQDKDNTLKNTIYRLEHYLVDAILLYAFHLKKYINPNCHKKTFVANNTINTTIYDDITINKKRTLSKYNITTSKNIICIGRMHKRKRIDNLIQAFQSLNMKDIGLVLVGTDNDYLLKDIKHERIYKIGPIYGENAIQLLAACDVYCLPGAVGLSIVDAFYCGLPFVTEDVDHGPEISYLQNGINGFIVPKGNILELSQKLRTLLTNEVLRKNISNAARKTIQTDGHISNMCKKFREALDYLFQ